jgi:hypothetical protein
MGQRTQFEASNNVMPLKQRWMVGAQNDARRDAIRQHGYTMQTCYKTHCDLVEGEWLCGSSLNSNRCGSKVSRNSEPTSCYKSGARYSNKMVCTTDAGPFAWLCCFSCGPSRSRRWFVAVAEVDRSRMLMPRLCCHKHARKDSDAVHEATCPNGTARRWLTRGPVLCISLEGLQPAVCCVVTCKASSIRARERHVARPTGALLASMQARDLRRSAYAVAWVSSC